MRRLILLLTGLLLLLQFNLWVGEGSLAEVANLRRENGRLQEEIARMRKLNERLAAEVIDLKQGREAVEERARKELGMIREGETFYQIIKPGPKP